MFERKEPRNGNQLNAPSFPEQFDNSSASELGEKLELAKSTSTASKRSPGRKMVATLFKS